MGERVDRMTEAPSCVPQSIPPPILQHCRSRVSGLSKEMTKALLKEQCLAELLLVLSGQGFQFYFLHRLTGQWTKIMD